MTDLDKFTTQQCLDLLDEAGLVHWPKKGAIPRVKDYLEDAEGAPIQDMILDIPTLSATNKERTGYPTQKPQALASDMAPSSPSEKQCSKRKSSLTTSIIPITVLLEPISHQCD